VYGCGSAQGIERERPEWSITLQGMRGSLTGKETVADVQPDLVRLEVELKTPVRSTVRVAAAQLNANSVGETKQLALEAKVEQLSSQLRALQNQPQASSSQSRGMTAGGQRKERRCFRCGALGHLVCDCPHPFAGHGTI
jgi:hypothetical protein